MSANRDAESLIDIAQAIDRILTYTENSTREEFMLNDEKQAAVLYRIAIVGEATKRISRQFREQHPSLPWREMAGIRDVILHDYDEVSLNVVWDVIQKLPDLLVQLTLLLPPKDPDA